MVIKNVLSSLFALVFLCGFPQFSAAIDYKISGFWLLGFGGLNSQYITGKSRNNIDDQFVAMEFWRLKLDAEVSEYLSGTIHFEGGDTTFGQAASGGALGADGKILEVKSAYLDFTVPDTNWKTRMGLQPVALPNFAGGSAVFNDDAAAIVSSYEINNHVGITGLWARPYNDNSKSGYLDNADLFALTMPLTFSDAEISPWLMLGMAGKNFYKYIAPDGKEGDLIENYAMFQGMMPAPYAQNLTSNNDSANLRRTFSGDNLYSTLFFAGIPARFNFLEDWNLEIDVNFGYASGYGHYEVSDRKDMKWRKGSSTRTGWLIKAFIEYKLDWSIPGFFGWYASGDDNSIANGSERMPYISPVANFTSFVGDGELGWSLWSGYSAGYDQKLSYSGTWGVGGQLRDASVFSPKLKHTLRAAFWGGTNSPAMIKYLDADGAVKSAGVNKEGFYLTTEDYLLEFNFSTTYNLYENLDIIIDLAYVINGIDLHAWTKYEPDSGLEKRDAWKAAALFYYHF